jgi:hypothetical protein
MKGYYFAHNATHRGRTYKARPHLVRKWRADLMSEAQSNEQKSTKNKKRAKLVFFKE